MQSFLEKTIQYILSKPDYKPEDICLVYPNRRAGVFLKKYYSENLQTTNWLPDLYSIQDFVYLLTGLQEADPVELCFLLYEIHLEIEKESNRSFEEFLPFAQLLLGDFNEIDFYNTDIAKLFGFLTESKAIQLWNPEKQELTDFEKSYLYFYRSLETYYNRLKEILIKKNQAYEGLAYRILYEKLEKNEITISWEKIYFIGFNALNYCEQLITGILSSNGIAEMLWDADMYYLNDRSHEAGIFLRKVFKSNPEMKWVENHFSQTNRKIEILGVPGNSNQALLAGKLIQQEINKEPDGITNSAVVLADENLLLPFLNSLPQSIDRINVTMGFPLKYIPYFDFLVRFIQTHENRISGDSKNQFFTADLRTFFSHPVFTHHFIESEELNCKNIDLNKGFFITEEKLSDMLNGKSIAYAFVSKYFSNKINSSNEILILINDLIGRIKQSLIESKQSSLENDMLYSIEQIIFQLCKHGKNFPYIEPVSLLRKIFQQLVSISRLPFYGEPLTGLQVMGMLETRNLDFKNLILVSVNEGILPSGRTNNSLIPHDIRHDFGLPVTREKDAIFAYHFYRLLQRADNITLIYNTEPDKMNGGDISRFILQLLDELPRYNPQIQIKHRIVESIPVSPIVSKEINIPKTEEIFLQLKKKAEYGLSPTALSDYVLCSLKFYLKSVLYLKEEDVVSKTIDPRSFGIIIHEVLQIIYTGLGKYPVKAENLLQYSKDQILSLAKNAFQKNWPSGNFEKGENLLYFHMAVNQVLNFLKLEAFNIKKWEEENKLLTIVDMEKELDALLFIRNDSIKVVKIKGTADRIDKLDSVYRLIDYKTGKVDQNIDLKVDNWEDIYTEPKLAKSFQLMIYSWLLAQNIQDSDFSCIPGIISFKRINSGFLSIKKDRETLILNREILQEFERGFTGFIEDIFNPEIPFSQTDKVENCRFCPYSNICQR